MGMKHILRALDQALETAEVERKYLRDEMEAEREDMAGKLREMRREKERLQSAVDSLENENAKLREELEKWKKSR